MSDLEQLERETEQTRSQIADTLDELKASMTPGHVLDQLADRVGYGATAAFARNLKDQTVNNPLPIALIGAGLAWLMLSPRGSNPSFMRRSDPDDAADEVGRAMSGKAADWSERSSRFGEGSRETLSSATERARQAGGGAADAIRDTAGSMSEAARERASQTADAVRETAGSISASAQQTKDQAADALRSRAGAMSDSLQRGASAGYEAVADTARRTADTLSDSTRAVRERTLQSGNALIDFCREQPLVLAGVGLAVGAIVGALLPASETEDQLIGEASDRVKDRAQDFASEQYENAKKVGERAFEAAKDEAVKPAAEQEKTGGSKEEAQQPATEAKAETATLVPADDSELERRGQPWTSDNAPI